MNLLATDKFTDLVVKKIFGMDTNKGVLFVEPCMINYAGLN